MKRAIFFIAGGLIVFLSYTLFSSIGFDILAAAYAYALYMLFFTNSNPSLYYLLGITVAVELLGTAHLGVATLLCVLCLLLEELFAQRLRFTSLFTRFFISMSIGLLLYSLLLYSLQDWLGHFLNLLLLLPLLGLVGFYFSSLDNKPRYELL